MEKKTSTKIFMEVDERPSSSSYEHGNKNRDSENKTYEPSSLHNNTPGSPLLLSLSLNNTTQLPHQIQGKSQIQIGKLRVKLEEEKKENENLKVMLNLVNERCIVLQNRLLLHQLSSSPQYNHNLPKGNIQDEEKPVFPTRQFLNIDEPSPSDCSKREGFASLENNENIKIGRYFAYECINNIHEGKIISKKEDQVASEVECRRARVSIRARSDFSLMVDGCQWRKYGQKTAKGNPCPRAYYRCSMGTSCPVRKQVQRCFKDESVFITTYEGNHNHQLPPSAKPIANLTSSALNTFLSNSTTNLQYGNNISNTFLFSSPLSPPNSNAIATFSPSPTCPTITLDFTLPPSNYLQFKNHKQSSLFSFPFQGYNYPQSFEVFPNMIDAERKLALVDVVSEAIAKDPSLKATLFAAVSSFTNGDPLNINNHNQLSKSG